MALIFAAIAREDEAERLTLIDTAPRKVYELEDYHGIAEAFNLMTLSFIIEQLGLAWSCATLGYMEETEEILDAIYMSAYVFCVRADAWRAFCQDLGIDSGAALKGSPHRDSLDFAERLARAIAYDGEEAQAAFERAKQKWNLQGDSMTLDSARHEMQATFEKLAARW